MRLLPSFNDYFPIPFLTINNDSRDFTETYYDLKPKGRVNSRSLTGEQSEFRIPILIERCFCRISRGQEAIFTNNPGADIASLNRSFGVNITYSIEAIIKTKFMSKSLVTWEHNLPKKQQEPIYFEGISCFQSHTFISTCHLPHYHLLQPSFDSEKYVPINHGQTYANDDMKFQTLYTVDPPKQKSYCILKHFEWIAGKQKSCPNQTMSTVKVIANRPDPILYLPESITSSSVQRLTTNPIVGNYITYLLKFIYSPTTIDELPQAPPLITVLEP